MNMKIYSSHFCEVKTLSSLPRWNIWRQGSRYSWCQSQHILKQVVNNICMLSCRNCPLCAVCSQNVPIMYFFVSSSVQLGNVAALMKSAPSLNKESAVATRMPPTPSGHEWEGPYGQGSEAGELLVGLCLGMCRWSSVKFVFVFLFCFFGSIFHY